jgi:hypothetical protein
MRKIARMKQAKLNCETKIEAHREMKKWLLVKQ